MWRIAVSYYVMAMLKHAPGLALGKGSRDAGSECQKARPAPHCHAVGRGGFGTHRKQLALVLYAGHAVH